MAKPIRKRDARRRGTKDETLPLGRQNFIIIGIGILLIIAGYIAMLEGSVEGFVPLVLAPIFLVVGYCVIIPIGILYKKSEVASQGHEPSGEAAAKTS